MTPVKNISAPAEAPSPISTTDQTVVGPRTSTCLKTAYVAAALLTLIAGGALVGGGIYITSPESGSPRDVSSRRSLALFCVIAGEFCLSIPCLMTCLPFIIQCRQYSLPERELEATDWIPMEPFDEKGETVEDVEIPVEEVD